MLWMFGLDRNWKPPKNCLRDLNEFDGEDNAAIKSNDC